MQSIVNILGLGLGISVCVLIVLFVHDERSFDKFHKKGERIYRVFAREDWGENQQFFNTNTPFPMGPALKDNFPEVEHQVRFNNVGSIVKVGESQFTETIAVGGKDFFQVFDFEVISGDPNRALSNQNSVVLTKRYAQKYFGDSDPIGKSITLQLNEKEENFEINSVIKNIPGNSSIQFDILISDLNYPKLYSQQTITSAWFNINPETYILLREGVDKRTIESKFPSLFETILGEKEFHESKYAAGLQLLTDIHLNTDYPVGIAPVNSPKYSYVLAAIALLILLVACINFVTLSVGRSIQRAKEVGIRKVVGAERSQIIFQFIGEALIVTMTSLIVGIVLSVLALPLFNDLAGKQLHLEPTLFIFLTCLSLVVIIGLMAGSYPAFLLSNFRPILIFKGNLQGASSKQGLRKVLVGVQVVLSIFLISSTLVMQKQLSFLQNKDLGFNREQLAVVQLNAPRVGRMSEKIRAGFAEAEMFKAELSSNPEIIAVGTASHDFGNGAWTSIGFTDDNGTYRNFNMNVIDDKYIPTLKMEMVQGRNFSSENPSDIRRGVIINEAFAKEYGWTDAVGKKIPGKAFADHEVVGVIKDFNYSSLYTKVSPLAMAMDPMIFFSGAENMNVDNSPIPKLMIRLRPGNMENAIGQIRTVWEKLSDGEEFSFAFIDQALAAQYRNDQNLGKIVSIATLLAMVIGSLGLYALATLAMQNRIKEISIRKVMGASGKSLLLLLSGEYVYLILISTIISVPITWYAMSQWLQSFEYRVTVGWEVFAMAGILSMTVALLAISYQTIKTTMVRPAETLKYE